MGEYKQVGFIAALIVAFVVVALALQLEQAREDKAEMQREINRLNAEKYVLCVKLADGFCTYTIN